ncbi:MAG TPA: N,N-dimethylformamidase beta subunit family domain-containing protein [Pseudonocardia sp.]
MRILVALFVLALVAGCTTAPALVPPQPSDTPPTTAPVPGNADWTIRTEGAPHAIEGFADRVSVMPGDAVRLFVSTTASSWRATAFRLGKDARSVWTSPPQPGREQPAAVVTKPTNTVVAPWAPALTVTTAGWDPGDYLFRLDAPGAQQYVPLTVRTPSNAGRVVIVNAVTTWQAYNQWGGYSLYKGPDGQRPDRARAVSFDRPYELGMLGAGQFLQFELGAVRVAEQAGIPLGYATDVDLHADPHLLDGARAMITLGHDEYWSTAMRAAATTARDQGVNLAFLGGNEVYRHIRFGDTPLGPNRLEINYKSFAEDPDSKTDPTEATQDWRLPPDPRPESVLVGNTYKCFPGRASLVVADPTNWMLNGLVHAGQALPGAVGIEYSGVDLQAPTPRPIDVLFHSPVLCGTTHQRDFADAVYYTTPSGAGVFESGTQDWVCGMDPHCTGPAQAGHIAPILDAISTRLFTAFAAGPAGRAHPAVDNLAKLDITPGAHKAFAPDVD